MADEQVQGETPATAGETPAPTSEAFDEARAKALIDKLRGENRELAKVQKRLLEMEAEVAKKKEAEMTELEKVKAEAEKLKADLRKVQLEKMRFDAAQKVGLPAALAARLQGETPDELEADAKAILELLPKPAKPGAPNLSPTNPGNAQTGETEAQAYARIHGRQINPWDSEFLKSVGGGVLAPKFKGDTSS